MVAPPVVAVSPGLLPPCLAVVEQQTEKALLSESTPSQLGFPDEFPYEFDSSPFTSPGDSTETEDETSDDEEDFLAGLTRRLSFTTQRLPTPPPSAVTDKAEVKPANSPESTLNRLGSDSTSGNRSPSGPFSQVPSPPPSPFREEDSLKVISAAAGEVAKIKMANFDSKPTSRPNPNPNSFIPFPQNAAFCNYYWLWNLQMQNSLYHQSLFRFGSTLQPPLIASPFPVRGVFPAPTAVKTPSTGTGVFLPRRSPNPSDSGKKSGDRCAKFRTKVVHQQNLKAKEFSSRCQPCSKDDHEWPSLKPNSGGCLSEGGKTSSKRMAKSKTKLWWLSQGGKTSSTRIDVLRWS